MPTILVVEDETNIRHFLVVNLKARGYTMLQAPDAENGLEQLGRHRPDALLLDIKLPGMSGWGMLKTISSDARLPQVPVIVISASPFTNHPDEQVYPHIIDRLVKPVTVDDLVHAVGKLFQQGNHHV